MAVCSTCVALTVPAQAQVFGQLDYAKSARPLDVNGRDIPLKFGAALLGYRYKHDNVLLFSGALGRGYDPKVSSSFLSADASGPATCDVLLVGLVGPPAKLGVAALNLSLDYRVQRVGGKFDGMLEDEPFGADVVLRTHYLIPAIALNNRFESGSSAYVRVGAMLWNLRYQAYGEVERAKIWTQSQVKGWGPIVSIGAEFELSATKFVAQLEAYRLDADNKVWIPGVSVAISK
jgi:hypothetical protein